MSRYERKVNGLQNMPEATIVSYGYDHACGFFIQVLDKDDELLLDRDSMFNDLTGAALASHLKQFEVDVPAMHFTSMMLDLPF